MQITLPFGISPIRITLPFGISLVLSKYSHNSNDTALKITVRAAYSFEMVIPISDDSECNLIARPADNGQLAESL